MSAHDYPNPARLKRDLHTEFRLLIDKHNALMDAHAQTVQRVTALEAQLAQVRSTPPPNGATNSKVLGAPIQPSDLSGLADGAKLTWVKARGTFAFI